MGFVVSCKLPTRPTPKVEWGHPSSGGDLLQTARISGLLNLNWHLVSSLLNRYLYLRVLITASNVIG